jgi:phosphonate transport system substrate-binding protein
MSTHDPARRLLLRRIAAAALAASASRIAAQPTGAPPLRVGLVPYLSTRALITLYQPLREHLERALQRPVRLYTAQDFRALAVNARNGEYDIALLPPHIARIAVADWGQRFVARFAQTSEVQLVTLSSTELALPDGLRGQRVAAIDPLSITTLVLRHWLAERGLAVGRDVDIRYVHSISSGMVALERGDAVALVGAIGQFRDAIDGGAAQLKVVASLAAIPTPAFVAHPRVSDDDLARIRQALLGFVPQSAGAGISSSPFVTGSVEDFVRVESYAIEARRLLAQTK